MSAERPYEERSRPGEGQRAYREDADDRYEEVTEGKRCPNCGSHCISTADLCEVCGHWLLDGQCRYCYQPYKPGQHFCTHCGNPPEGIVCKQCNIKTHFDVCPTCHIPLSRRAGPAQEAMREEERMILEAVKEMMPVESAEEAALAGEYGVLQKEANQAKKALGQLEDYYGQDPPAGAGAVGPAFGFSGGQQDFSAELRKGKEAEQARADRAMAEARRRADDQARIEGVLRRIEQVKKDKENALIAEKIRELQDRTFPDQQSARLYSMQVQAVLEHLGHCTSWIGWKCNAYGCVHFNGPMGCSSPQLGGRWVCESEVSFSGEPGEFVLEGVPHTPRTDNPQASCP